MEAPESQEGAFPEGACQDSQLSVSEDGEPVSSENRREPLNMGLSSDE